MSATTAGSVPSLPRMSPTRERKSAAVIPPDMRCATNRTLPMRSAPAAAFDRGRPRIRQPAAFEFLLGRLDRSTRLATRAGTSSEGTFSDDASPAISARSLARWRNDSSPT